MLQNFQHPLPRPNFRSISAPYRMTFGAFLIAQYHATPLSHSRQRLRLRVCFWLAPLLS